MQTSNLKFTFVLLLIASCTSVKEFKVSEYNSKGYFGSAIKNGDKPDFVYNGDVIRTIDDILSGSRCPRAHTIPLNDKLIIRGRKHRLRKVEKFLDEFIKQSTSGHADKKKPGI